MRRALSEPILLTLPLTARRVRWVENPPTCRKMRLIVEGSNWRRVGRNDGLGYSQKSGSCNLSIFSDLGWRRGWDSNPRAAYATRRFRGAPVTTTSVPLRARCPQRGRLVRLAARVEQSIIHGRIYAPQDRPHPFRNRLVECRRSTARADFRPCSVRCAPASKPLGRLLARGAEKTTRLLGSASRTVTPAPRFEELLQQRARLVLADAAHHLEPVIEKWVRQRIER